MKRIAIAAAMRRTKNNGDTVKDKRKISKKGSIKDSFCLS
jgi:hypothetical protein